MAKRTRILFTIPNFHKAGSGKVVYDLVNGLDRSKFDIEIACHHNKGPFYKEVEKLGLKMHIFKTSTSYRPYWSLLKRIRNISKFFKKEKYDVVHSWHWSSDWTEALAARFSGAKWLYTKKAMSWDNKHWKIRSYLAHFIVNINDEMKDYYPNKKAQALIPLGIDVDYYSPDHFQKDDHTDDVFNIITVANLVPVKGIEVLIKAVHKLNDNTIKLTVLGNKDNEYGQQMEDLVKSLNMEDQIYFVGKKPDVRPFVTSSDLYVIPTLNQGRKEGMPMALVEAMSMGIPLLGSNISGINYVLKDFKEYLFEAEDIDTLSTKILDIKKLTPEERHKIGTDLRDYCVEHFSMEKFIDAHEMLYKKLVS